VQGNPASARDQQIMVLRGKIPERLLAHYDSLMANERKGVAKISSGSCSECRQPVAASASNGLAHGHPIQICIHCRCFLYRPVREVGGKPGTASRGSPVHRRRNLPPHV
jgi:predicted  nucleic acid-binding Zn-ribbon protein